MTAWQRTPTGGTGAGRTDAGRPFPAPAYRWDNVYRWDAAAVMFFPGRGRTPGESRPVVQRFDVDSVHHGSTATRSATPTNEGRSRG